MGMPVHPPASAEVDVELVPESAPVLLPAQVVAAAKEERSLFDPDRRDWIMLAAGAAGVLLAVGLGYGIARLMRKPPEEVPPQE
jgi:hypothetical protein